jgi:isoleucyl-tRNA synthetase
MGADLIRWIFCRTNPATNINFGPVTADEVRARFVLKLWNTYAFFCNYARLDKFDPNAPQVPLKDRPDIDRWILSDLQKLIAFARKSFENHDLAALCLEAERFIDDKVSNWYVRRNRRRFWKAEQGTDKLAAYQTLHQVLLTFTKLLAPIMPFLAEKIYRNLVDAGDHSIHLEDYPAPDPKMIDEVLSEDMEALLHKVNLGSASRNTVKIKVRQPLAELRVLPGNDADRRAILRFADQLCEELNLKKASLHDASAGPLLVPEIKANAKNLGPRFGQRLKDVQQAILKADPLEILKHSQAGAPFQLVHGAETFDLEPADLFISLKAQEGWTGVADRDTQVALDTRITEVLALEGMARDIIRQVQDLRKKSGLEMEDRIILHLETPSELLGKSIAGHRDYIASETLVLNYSATAPTEAQVAQVKIETHELTITLKKA